MTEDMFGFLKVGCQEPDPTAADGVGLTDVEAAASDVASPAANSYQRAMRKVKFRHLSLWFVLQACVAAQPASDCRHVWLLKVGYQESDPAAAAVAGLTDVEASSEDVAYPAANSYKCTMREFKSRHLSLRVALQARVVTQPARDCRHVWAAQGGLSGT